MSMQDLGSLVKSLRHSKGMSRKQMSDLAGSNHFSAQRLENEGANITVVTLMRFAKALGVSASELMRVAEKGISASDLLRSAEK